MYENDQFEGLFPFKHWASITGTPKINIGWFCPKMPAARVKVRMSRYLLSEMKSLKLNRQKKEVEAQEAKQRVRDEMIGIYGSGSKTGDQDRVLA